MKRKHYIFLSSSALIIACIFLLSSFSKKVIAPSTTSTNAQVAFLHYPINKTVPIGIKPQLGSGAELTDRERLDQIRDWLLYAIISDAQLSNQQMADVTFDLPVTRSGYNEAIANFDYTTTRSRNLADGTLIALIPAGTEQEELEYIAHVADEQRKNTGTIATALELFRYKIDLEKNQATITRGNTIKGADVFTSGYGYFEQKVQGLNDLSNFLNKTQDLVYVNSFSDGYVLGGREFKLAKNKNLTVEDIAAIFQSEQKIKKDNDDFDSRWSNRTYTGEFEKRQLEKERDEEFKSLNLVSASGFSLDPSFKYDELLKVFDIARPFLSKYDNGFKLETVRNAILKKDETPLFEFLYDLKQDPDEKARNISKRVFEYVNTAKFQKARYDGYLKGTEVGMHLFYTDLLAKLWTMNFVNSSPVDQITGFVSDIYCDQHLSNIYSAESDSFPSCRLWFGPNNSGYQTIGKNNQLLFARNATKIYSASSDPFQPGKEVPVSALFAGSINWMNGHYEEIAAYEQEYQVLNEIMKWSLLIGWMNSNDNAAALSFLKDVNVNRNNRFPQWVHQHPELKFNQWDKIQFYPAGYQDVSTEALPLLSSAGFFDKYTWQNMVISGGVSLAEKTAFERTATLSESISPALRRSSLDYAETGGEIKMLKGPAYKFEVDEHELKIVSKANEGSRLRSKYDELANVDFERNIVQEGENLKMKFGQGDLPIGDLKIANENGGFKIAFQGKDIERGQHFAKNISDIVEPDKYVRQSSDIESFVTVESNKEYLIQLKGSERWARFKIEDEPDVFLTAEWDSRVAGNEEFSKIVKIKWLKDEDLTNMYTSKDVTIGTDGSLSLVSGSEISKSKTIDFTLNYDSKNISSKYNTETGEIYLERGSLDKGMKDVGNLRAILNEEDLAKIKQLASKGAPFNYKSEAVVNRLANDYKTGEYDLVINDFKNSANTGILKKEFRARYFNDLGELDRINDPNTYERALNEMLDGYSNTPELSLRKAFFELKEGLYQNAEESINNAILHNANNSQFLDDLQMQIQRSAISSADAETLKSYLMLQSGMGGDATKVAFNAIPKGKEVSHAELLAGLGNKKANVLIENNPSLNNLDWNPVFRASNHSVSALPPDARVVLMDNTSLSDYRFELKIHESQNGSGQYSFDISAVPKNISISGGQSSQSDSLNRPTYYIYLKGKAA